jgi:hypothetical protein
MDNIRELAKRPDKAGKAAKHVLECIDGIGRIEFAGRFGGH